MDPDSSQTDSNRHDPFHMPADAVRRNITPTPASTGVVGLLAHSSLQIPQLKLRRKEGRMITERSSRYYDIELE